MRGVTEIRAGFTESLRRIGKQDERGDTVVVSHFGWTGFRLVPLVLRTLGLMALVALLFVRHPFGWLPAGPEVGWIAALRGQEAFSLGSWLAAFVLYLAYFGISLVKNGLYTGQPGAEMHFTRHSKIVRTVRPGDRAVIVDPRVKPYAVVSTKPTVLMMDPVSGPTKDNISLTFRGALVLRVTDTYRLLERGGLDRFTRQLGELYESILKDHILQIEARDFNRFFIEPVAVEAGEGDSITDKLRSLEGSELSVELLTELSEIDELDVARFDLVEAERPERRTILPMLQRLADDYGIEVMDHVPLGNVTSEAFLETLALPLVSSVIRLRQATDTLGEIYAEEIDAEITARVADKRLVVLAIKKIVTEMASITETLRSRENETSIVDSRRTAMRNTVDGILASIISQAEALLAEIRAQAVSTAALERYVREFEGLFDEIEAEIESYVPEIRRMVVSETDEASLLPAVDALERVFVDTGTREALDRLGAQADEAADPEALDREIARIEDAAAKLSIDASMREIEEALAGIESDSGISTEEYSPERVMERIDRIAREADLTDSEITTEQEAVR